ncbi:MAG: hypothetical protein ACLQG5_13580 [Methanobacterium sp.]
MKAKIINDLRNENALTWDTLVSKIMLGVVANVPAFYTNFCRSMHMQKLNISTYACIEMCVYG